MTPNAMPSKGSPLTTVTRHREVNCSEGCCPDSRTEKVPSIKRGPRTIRNTQLADQLNNLNLKGTK